MKNIATISIDFSLNAPAIYITAENENYPLAFVESKKKNHSYPKFIKTFTSKNDFERQKQIISEIFKIIPQHSKVIVAFEDFAYGSTKGKRAMALIGSNYVLRYLLKQNYDCEILSLAVTSIKKDATGKGNATKEEMIGAFLLNYEENPLKIYIKKYMEQRITKLIQKPIDDIVDAVSISNLLQKILKKDI